MGILVKHSGSPSIRAAAGFGAAQGIRRQQMEDDRLKMLQQEKAREDEQSFRADQNELSRQYNLESQKIANINSQDNMRLNADLQSGLADKAQIRRQEDFEYEYSEQQRRQVAEMEEGYRKAQESGEYSPDELSEIRAQIDARQMGIKPVKRLKKKSPYPEGQGIGEIWNSPDGSFLFTRDDKGNIKKMGETNKNPTWKDRIEAMKMFTERYTTESKDGKKKTIDYDAVEQAMQKMFAGAGSGTPDPLGIESSARRHYDLAGNTKTEESGPAKMSATEELKRARVADIQKEIADRRAEIAKGNKKPGPDWNPMSKSHLEHIAKLEEELKKLGVTDVGSSSVQPSEINELFQLPKDKLQAEVAASSKRTGVPESVIWDRLNKKRLELKK